MPQTYRIALLEDNPKQLEKLAAYLEKIPNAELVLKSKNSDDFFEQLKTTAPDILIADLDLGNDSMTGIEVAIEVKLPVFFASINTADYIEDLEALKREDDLCVDHLTKPFTEAQFAKSFTRFLKEIELFSTNEYVYLDFNKKKGNKVLINDIVFISSSKGAGSVNNDKQIHFINQKPERLIDFSFSKMEEKGLLNSHFITIHKAFRVNKKHIKSYQHKTAEITVKFIDHSNKTVSEPLKVSENYQSVIKKMFR